MVTSDDILFWTGLTVSEADASRYAQVAETKLGEDIGDRLSGDARTEALCYLIAAKISNKLDNNQITSESIGGYSYSKAAATSSSKWLDLYNEIISTIAQWTSSACESNGVKRVDTEVLRLNRRYNR